MRHLTAALLLTGLAALDAGAGAFAAPTAGDKVPLLGHRAVYRLTLGKASGPKAPADARGMIAYDFSGSACEGYAMKFRQVTEIQPEEGTTRSSDMNSTTFEEGDGSGFRFKIQTTQDGTGPSAVDGAAERNGGGLSIALSRPQREKLDLGDEVVFPTDQTIRLVRAARAGERTLALKVFDGTDTGKKVYDTLAIIGPARAEAAPEQAAQDAALKGLARWPVAISYFEPGKTDAPPVYVLSFDLYENGVSRALKLDYGDFVLNGEMTRFEALPAKACDK